MNDCFLAYGQLLCKLDFPTLRQICEGNGVLAQIRSSSHYEREEYLLLTTPKEARISFERIAECKFLLRGEAESKADLLQVCQLTSTALSNAQLRHSIEFYDLDDQLFAYLHHNWLP
jgi:hypothetical protein